jgi:hypothetical protein
VTSRRAIAKVTDEGRLHYATGHHRKPCRGTRPDRLADMPPKMPETVFLDTTVVNFILEYGEQIHDGVAIPDEATAWVSRDIQALRNIWLTGQRASWRFTISPGTVAEIQRTAHEGRLHDLLNWASELWDYSENCAVLSCSLPTVRQIDFSSLSLLPDAADRNLIQEAVGGGCDAFCTRDWKTILRYRRSLRGIPVSLISPHEWWQTIIPYAALFV